MKKDKLFIILALFMALVFTSCASGKYYTDNPNKYGCKHRDINTKPFNK